MKKSKFAWLRDKNVLLVEPLEHMRLHGLGHLNRPKATKVRKQRKATRDAEDEADCFVRGSFVLKTIKGIKYWYFQNGKTRKQDYIGRDNSYLRHIITAYKEQKQARDIYYKGKYAKQIIGMDD